MALSRLRFVTHRRGDRYPGVTFRRTRYTDPGLAGMAGRLVVCTTRSTPDTGWRMLALADPTSGETLTVAIEREFERALAVARTARFRFATDA